ncbi:hypothetical protein D0C16_01015 [Cellvibrio sp. KY-GH-1]|uniref:hypothetical protein n=1 Tax=Cellvibrio sp. KY-GH-1 TaxID=2303332 RepID=UPI0012443015|nr:hypothetical protein [Cellvibrio sp. KY-GH-1]QEY14680.1 hypothetical protein D0C16_01015 [Cellvibrio sp. KY-GH-1]
MVVPQAFWWPDAIFFCITDGGATWTRIWDWAGYRSKTQRYTLDISEVPWLNFGVTCSNNPAAPTGKLGRMNEPVEIASTYNSNHLMYGIGATMFKVVRI